MDKKSVARAPALSCVEAYFIAYFENRFDVRALYAESFAPFQEAFSLFAEGKARYENFPLPRVQETSERLGLTYHEFSDSMRFGEGGLTLIRVNRKFFENYKLLPWREDHWIALHREENGYSFVNNYPLSEGVLSEERLREVYGGGSICFRRGGRIREDAYGELRENAFSKLREYEPAFGQMPSEEKIRDALAVLKTLRRRTCEWLRYEHNGFCADAGFESVATLLNERYERALVAVQLQIARRRGGEEEIQKILQKVFAAEEMFADIVKRRIER